MLVPYENPALPPKEDIMKTVTEAEREYIREIEMFRMMSMDRMFSCANLGQPSLVLDDFLFLGNMQQAKDQELLEKLQIRHILNVCDWQPSRITQDKFNVTHISLQDDPQTDIKQHFDRTNRLLREYYDKRERCLVHCAAGVSRSATIVLAYLMKYHHRTLREAYAFLKEKRPQVGPNEGFLLQLIRYESELIRTREIEPDKAAVIEENPIDTFDEFERKHAEYP